MIKLFVYGTLKKGHDNHHYLNGCDLIQEAVTTEPIYDLYSVKFGHYPCMVNNGSYHIFGEVYNVDQNTLKNIDILEGHPTFYTRKMIDIMGIGDCWVYILNTADSSINDFLNNDNIKIRGDKVKTWKHF